MNPRPDSCADFVGCRRSVKSLMLSFVDVLRKVADFNNVCFLPRHYFERISEDQSAFKTMASLRSLDLLGDQLSSVMKLWRQGVCLVDEVDMVLHPLRRWAS